MRKARCRRRCRKVESCSSLHLVHPDSHFYSPSIRGSTLLYPQNTLHASAALLSLVSLIFLDTSSCSPPPSRLLVRLRLDLVELIEFQSCISVSSEATEELEEVEEMEKRDEERERSFGRKACVRSLVVDVWAHGGAASVLVIHVSKRIAFVGIFPTFSLIKLFQKSNKRRLKVTLLATNCLGFNLLFSIGATLLVPGNSEPPV